MTPTQVSEVLAMSGDTYESPAHVKSVSTSSGKVYLVNQSLTAAGRYTVVFNSASELVAFTPIVPQSQGPETAVDTEWLDMNQIESIGMFAPTS